MKARGVSDRIEHISKTAALISTLAAVILLIVTGPDQSGPLRAACYGALLVGLLAGRHASSTVIAVCLFAAAAGPAFFRLAFGRNPPTIDLLWMAPLAGVMLRSSPWSVWRLPPAWRVLLGGWGLILSVLWPVMIARESAFRLAGLLDVEAMSSSVWSSPHAIAWILQVTLTQLLGLLWLERLSGDLRSSGDRLPSSVHALWIGGTVAGAFALLQGIGDIGWLSTPEWTRLGRATGTMLDANALGVTAAIAGPVAVAALWRTSANLPMSALLPLAISWGGVWMSGSRTAVLAAVVAMAGLVVALWRTKQLLRRASLYLVGALVAALLVGQLATSAVGPVQRLLETPRTLSGLSGLWYRDGWGRVAEEMIREHPLTGVGIGTFHVLAPDYSRRLASPLPPDNAQNWWRHQLAELGIVGASLVFLWSALLAWRVVRAPSRIENTPHGPILRSLLWALGLISLVGMPTQQPLILFWFFLLVGWLTTDRLPDEAPRLVPALRSAAWVSALVLAFGLAAGHVVHATRDLSVTTRAALDGRDYLQGAYGLEVSPTLGQFRWIGHESRQVLRRRGTYLVLRIWVMHPDVASDPVLIRLTTPCGVLFEERLRDHEPVTVAIETAEESKQVDFTITSSRTWRPADQAGSDQRELGAAVATRFVDAATDIDVSARRVTLPRCGG